jgi:hypothetical protein
VDGFVCHVENIFCERSFSQTLMPVLAYCESECKTDTGFSVAQLSCKITRQCIYVVFFYCKCNS